MWFVGVEVEQETSVHPPKKNPESAPVRCEKNIQLTVKKRSSMMKTSFKTLSNTKITDRLLH